jgi:hypothetical protein
MYKSNLLVLELQVQRVCEGQPLGFGGVGSLKELERKWRNTYHLVEQGDAIVAKMRPPGSCKYNPTVFWNQLFDVQPFGVVLYL